MICLKRKELPFNKSVIKISSKRQCNPQILLQKTKGLMIKHTSTHASPPSHLALTLCFSNYHHVERKIYKFKACKISTLKIKKLYIMERKINSM